MCTVAVFGDDEGGLWLVGNRDEAYWRSAAEPPEVRDSVAIWPRDPDGGGTWTAVNQFGVALSLLSNYQGTTGQARDPISRGQIIVQLAQAEALDEVAAADEDGLVTETDARWRASSTRGSFQLHNCLSMSSRLQSRLGVVNTIRCSWRETSIRLRRGKCSKTKAMVAALYTLIQ